MHTTSALGTVTGWAMAPVFGLVSLIRHARTFHPRGPVLHAVVTRHEAAPMALEPLVSRLVGPALVRFSGALWKNAESLLDVLGCAVRFRREDSESERAADDDQDLLFATIKRPWTMPFSPLTTATHDYLGNDYFAVSPFDAGLGRRVYFKIHPRSPSEERSGPRAQRLARAIASGDAQLDMSVGSGPFGPWTPLVTIRLERFALVDGEALRFQPFRTGRGVRPTGFVHALRLGVYALSQRARPRHAMA